MTGHLGYEEGDPAGRGSGNSRNGRTPKTVSTEVGQVGLDVPRDRNGSVQSAVGPQGARRLGGLDDMIISLYAGGMTVRDIQHHLARTVGTEMSHETISKITDAVLEEVKAWQSRPLEAIYPIVYFDALIVKVRDGHQVRNKAAHIAVGVDLDGVKYVLGIWVQTTEGAKFWAGVCAELANRGVRDILIACCDGLVRLPGSDRGNIPGHDRPDLRRASDPGRMRSRTGTGRRPPRRCKTRYIRPRPLPRPRPRWPSSPKLWGRNTLGPSRCGKTAWDRFIPFFEFPPEVRKILYTTNGIETLNYQLRKITKNRGHFPGDDAAIKLLWLAISTSKTNAPANEPKRKAPLAAPAKPPADSLKAPPPTRGDPRWRHCSSPTPNDSRTTSDRDQLPRLTQTS